MRKFPRDGLIRRRKFGIAVPVMSAPNGAPVALVVKTGTDQGLRQEAKVARAYEVGIRRLIPN